MWGAFPDYVEEQRRTRRNDKFLKGVVLPEALKYTADRAEAVKDAEVVVGQLNGLYKFTASFEDVPPEPTQLYVGDYSVCVTNAGDYVFLLEKGTEYEFGTWPFDEEVGYFAQDDMADGAPMLMSWWGGWESPGEWTIDGGWNWLYYPMMYEWGCQYGYCCMMPTLQGAPDFTVDHVSLDDFPREFTAILSDYAHLEEVAFEWSGDDETFEIVSPSAQTTMVRARTFNEGRQTWLGVSTQVGGYSLYSSLSSWLEGTDYWTNIFQTVQMSLSLPKGIALDGVGRELKVGFVSLVATNGYLMLTCPQQGNDKVSFWSSATNGVSVTLPRRIEVSALTNFTCYAKGTVLSSGYEDIKLRLEWFDPNGTVRRTIEKPATVFACYAEPVNNVSKNHNGQTLYYNPSFLQSNTNGVFKVDVQPTAIPDSEIKWKCENGNGAFSGGPSGREVEFNAASGDPTIGIEVLGCPDERARFKVRIMQ